MGFERLLACGKPTDWMVHMLGQAVAAYTDATHGHTLSAVSGAYYRLLIERSEDAAKKFRRLATSVWDIVPAGKTDKEIASEGLARMEDWMRELGLAMDTRPAVPIRRNSKVWPMRALSTKPVMLSLLVRM